MEKLEYKVDKNGIVGVQFKFSTKRNRYAENDSIPYCTVSTIMPLGNDSAILEPCVLVDNQFQRVSAYPNTNSYLYYIFNEIFGIYKAVIQYNRRCMYLSCNILQADARSLRVVPKSENRGVIECNNWGVINSDLVPYIKSQIVQSSSLFLAKEEAR